MEIRPARIQDVDEIHNLISSFAQYDRMLFRSKASLYENIQTFHIAISDSGEVVACCALSVMWSDLAEVKSLAVNETCSGQGIGRKLVEEILKKATLLGIARVFALTLEPVFFEKLSFKRIDKASLPMKVWSDCASCPKQDHCDEIAVEIKLG